MVKRILLVWVGISLMLVGLGYAQPNIPKEKIPSDIDPEVRKQIERLYSSDAVERAYAATTLGNMREKATPAIPYLIEILKDGTLLEWNKFTSAFPLVGRVADSPGTSPGEEADVALGKIGKSAVEPLIAALKDKDKNVRWRAAAALGEMTGQNFGYDVAKWQEWWEKNKK